LRAALQEPGPLRSSLLLEARVALRYLTWKANRLPAGGKARDEIARASSIVIQVLLSGLGLDWPVGTFRVDLRGPGSGPQTSELGVKAAAQYKEGVRGWRKVAKELLPEEYQEDATAAAKKVQKAAQSILVRYPGRPLTDSVPPQKIVFKGLSRS
jgi:hypothetical protein